MATRIKWMPMMLQVVCPRSHQRVALDGPHKVLCGTGNAGKVIQMHNGVIIDGFRKALNAWVIWKAIVVKFSMKQIDMGLECRKNVGLFR
jgi:hypothetical protein